MDKDTLELFRKLPEIKQKEIIAFVKMLSSCCGQAVVVHLSNENKDQ